ncbi:hypothetical protein H5410_032774 [Solanum commersonii]|uniref:SWIM-type domain-containing protein n=1 Tax=Solanum commersonii TaxID=4109 RepID=A0A9J5YQL4_SOLCO|nr:hypothetical protein H5410_032774 [Solanum commersonii]
MRSFVDDTDELYIIFYRHPSIRKMVSTIYPASYYGCCMRHLGENIRNNFHNSKVVTHFYKAAKTYDRCEFNDHFNQIRDLIPKAAETLERIEFHTWSRAFCPGNRYNIMTSNIAESVNSMFDVEREFSIVSLFDEINRRFALLFHQRRMELVNSANRFVPSIEKDISKYVNAGNKLLAHQIANYKFSITGHGYVATVDLQRRTCTCRIFYLDKIPCPHAMEIHPVPPKDSLIVPLDAIEKEIHLPYVDKSKPGRRRYKRRRGVGDSFLIRKNKCLELLIDIVEMIASYSLKDLMRVKLSSRVLSQVANEPSVYQKVTLINFSYHRWLIVQEAISFLEMCRASENLEALYRKDVSSFFNRNDPTALELINQAADGGHIGASYVLAIISIFNGGESIREGLMFIANMKKMEPLKVRRCRYNLRNILGGMWVPESHLLGGRPICCIVHQFERIGRRNGWPMGSDNEDDIRCDLCSCDLELDYVVKFLPYTTISQFRVLNQVTNEPSEYQKVILLSIPVFIWPCSVVRRCTSFLKMCRASKNLEALYRKNVYDFFNRSDSNELGILSQAADSGHIDASYVLAIISIFNGGESMRKGLMFITNMTPLKLRRCREKLRDTLYGRVPEPHLLGERPICYTVQSLHFRCELCRCDLEIDEVVNFLY